MKKEDYSKFIYDNFYDAGEVKILLKDETIVHGIIVGVYHGDIASGEPFVIKWHVVKKEDLKKYNSTDEKEDIGRIINQKDIEEVSLK